MNNYVAIMLYGNIIIVNNHGNNPGYSQGDVYSLIGFYVLKQLMFK